MWEFIRPSSHAFSMISAGQVPSLSYSQATGRISFSAKSCAISRSAFCSSVSVKSTTGSAPRLTSQSTALRGYIPRLVRTRTNRASWPHGRHNVSRMQGAFAIVLFVVVGVAAVAAIWALVTSGGSYDQIGHGGLSIGDEQLPPAAPSSSAEREAEIRQMLEARN